MATFRVYATLTVDLTQDIEADSEAEAVEKAEKMAPSVRDATMLPWSLMIDTFYVEPKTEEVEDDDADEGEDSGDD